MTSPARPQPDASPQGSGPVGRAWIGMMWRCCHVYGRLYKNKAATGYEGRCPRCGTPAKIGIGPGGTDNRFFEFT